MVLPLALTAISLAAQPSKIAPPRTNEPMKGKEPTPTVAGAPLVPFPHPVITEVLYRSAGDGGAAVKQLWESQRCSSQVSSGHSREYGTRDLSEFT